MQVKNEKHQHKHDKIVAALQNGNLAVCACGDTKLIPSDYHD